MSTNFYKSTFSYVMPPYISYQSVATFIRTVIWQSLLIRRTPDGRDSSDTLFNPYPTAFQYGNGMVLHFYQQQESSTTKTVHKVINKELKTYV